jgi:hypothetical protein
VALVGLVAAVVRLFSAQLVSGLWRLALRTPLPIRSVLRRVADRIVPGWRAVVGVGRNKWPLESREIRGLNRPRFVIVGPMYLDLYLEPINVHTLDGSEFSDLTEVRKDCGGSACFAGRYLHQSFRKRSYLFSRLGKRDIFSKELEKKVRAEEWVRRSHITTAKDSQCGVSIHLVRRNASHTTFTHKGASGDLEWRPIVKKIRRRTNRGGGVIYLSGYMRTRLCNGLSESLRYLSPKFLICMDHGRFRAGSHHNEALALEEAFSSDLIDVYFCTYEGLRQYLAEVGADVLSSSTTPDPEEDYLKSIASNSALPRVTIVRSNPMKDLLTAHVILDGTVTPVEMPVSRRWPSNRPGLKNAFNVGFMHALVTGPPEVPFKTAVMDATLHGLENWARYA